MSKNDLHSSKDNVELMQNITNEEIVNKIIDTEEESKIVDKNKIILVIVYIISTIIIAFSLFYCLNIYNQDGDIQELTENIQNYIKEDQSQNSQDQKLKYAVDFNELNNINSDVVGWLIVDGLEINMPVVQTNNNDFYLKHSLDKSNNLSGWAFIDYRNKLDGLDKNIVIYGHNRHDNIIFSSLVNILNEEWYNNEENNQIMFINENGENISYQIFSVYKIEPEDYYINTDFSSDKEFVKFLETLKKRSIKNYNINLDEKSQILTLSTCGKDRKSRVVLHAVKQ